MAQGIILAFSPLRSTFKIIVDNIPEYDSKFNLIQKNISYWSSERKFWEKYVQPIMELYQTGFYNLTTNQTNEIQNSFARMKTEQQYQIDMADDLTRQYKAFSNAHGFEYVRKRG